MSDCLFCRIIAGDVPATLIHTDDDLVAFEDINPQAPLHALIVPRRHIATLNDVTEADATWLGRMTTVAATLAATRGHAATGYRTVFNCNRNAGQTVFHVHLHVLAGRSFSWPPG
jgi:histidine triad (HIT) family protein